MVIWKEIEEKDSELYGIIQKVRTAVRWADTVINEMEDLSEEEALTKCKVLLQFSLDDIEDAMEMIDDRVENNEYRDKAESEIWPGTDGKIPEGWHSSINTVSTDKIIVTAQEDEIRNNNLKTIDNWLTETELETRALREKLDKVKQLRMEHDQNPKNKRKDKSILGYLDPDTGDIGIED